MPLNQFRHSRDVASGAKGLSCTSKDDNVNASLATGGFERLGKIASHVTGEGIHFFRTIEGDRSDPGFFSDVDVVVGHKQSVVSNQ
jgi:hypothetical protein